MYIQEFFFHFAAIQNTKALGPKESKEQYKSFNFDYSYWSHTTVSTIFTGKRMIRIDRKFLILVS